MNTIERRKFIKQSMLGTLGLGVSSNIPLFLSNSLKAQTVIAQGVPNMLDAAKSHKILVLLQLEGGNDGLNTVIPYEDKKYYKARKTISVKEAQALKLEPIKSVEQSENKEAKKSKGSALGLHPEMTFFAEMYKEGQLAVINNVGYEKPNRSHFKSGAIWQSGLEDVGWSSEAEIEENTGWLGRYFDAHCAGENNFVGAYYGDSPLAMQGVAFSGVSIADIGSEPFGFMKLRDELANNTVFRTLQETDQFDLGTKAAFVRNVASETQKASDLIRNTITNSKSSSRYPQTSLGKQLKTISEFITRGSSTRVYLAKIGGFDTHSGQAISHAKLWKQINDALEAFINEMKLAKLDSKVAVMTFSEFGRQVKENGTQGTDHGSAAPMFILGGNVKPGIYGNAPLLKSKQLTDFGGLKYETDFRQVYRSVIEQFFKVESKGIIADTYKSIDLFT